MKKHKKKKGEFLHRREGDLVKIEVRDSTRRVIYRNKFNISDKNALLKMLGILEKYSGHSLYHLIRERLKVGEWF